MKSKLVKLAGSFWSDVYKSKGIDFDRYITARHILHQQTLLDTQELLDCLDKNTIPIFHTVRYWHVNSLLNEIQLPPNVVFVKSITDKLIKPNMVLNFKEDFYLKDNKLIITNKNYITSTPVDLWLNYVKVDENYLNMILGAPLNLTEKSSKDYKNLLLLIYKCIRSELSVDDLTQIIKLFYKPENIQPINQLKTEDISLLPYILLPRTLTNFLTADVKFINKEVTDLNDGFICDPNDTDNVLNFINTLQPKSVTNLCELVINKFFKHHTQIYLMTNPKNNTKLTAINFNAVIRQLIPPDVSIILIEK